MGREVIEQGDGCRSEERRRVLLGERLLSSRGQQVRAEHMGVGGIKHHRLDRLVEDNAGVLEDVSVERVLARDKDTECVTLSSPRATPLLPKRCARAGPSRDHDGVKSADVDAEFERIRRGDAEQVPVAKVAFESATLLWEVAPSVGGDAINERFVDFAHLITREHRHRLCAATRVDEREGAYLRADEVGEEIGGLGDRGSTRLALALVRYDRAEYLRRLPQHCGHGPARRTIIGDRLDGPADQARGRACGVGHRR